MTGLTPAQEQRSHDRAERMRRDRMRRHRQRAALVIALVVLAVVGTAFAVRPAAPNAKSASRPGGAAATVTAAASVKTSPAATRAATATPVASRATPRATGAVATTSTAPATVTPAPAKPAKPKKLSPAPGVKTIVVDKSEQRVTLYKADGTQVDTFLCASGRTYPRVGKYKVYGHRKQSYSMYDNTTFFYFTMFVKSDKGNNIGFHSIPQKPNGKLVGGLGKPISHGCVRLLKAKAKFLYSWAKVGTRIIVKK